jgi:hypothetical protein
VRRANLVLNFEIPRDRGNASHIPDADRVGGSSLEVQAKQIEPSRHSPSPQRRTIGDRPQAPSAPGARVGGWRSRVQGGCIYSKVELLPVAVGRPSGASVPVCHRSPVASALPRRRPSDGEDREELCGLEEEVEPISTRAGQRIEAEEESTQHRSCSSASTTQSSCKAGASAGLLLRVSEVVREERSGARGARGGSLPAAANKARERASLTPLCGGGNG